MDSSQSTVYIHLNVTLDFERSAPEIEEAVYKGIVVLALKQLHGDIGAAMMVDLVAYNPKNLQGVLKVQKSDLVKLWSALTLFGFYENQRCAFIVRQEPLDFIPSIHDNQQGNSSLLSGCG